LTSNTLPRFPLFDPAITTTSCSLLILFDIL
jgi:hypothetical protein